jgi:5-methylcytosine-specific restriction endonuclease McrA
LGSKRYSDQDIIDNAKIVESMAGLLCSLGLKACGGNFQTIKQKVKILCVDTGHWTGKLWNKDRTLKSIEEYSSKMARRKKLISIRGYKCEGCGVSDWLGHELLIEVHHIDGNNKNNQIDNLQLLCPNCHSITPNFRNKKRS